MSLIDKNLLADEKIIFRTGKHIIIFVPSVVLLILSLFFGLYLHSMPFFAKIEWIPPVIGFVYFLYAYLEYVTAEFVVTNKRVAMREGFFNKHANELRIATISQVNVNQGIVGQMLGYGDIALNAFGAYDVFVYVARAMEFQGALNAQLDTVTGGK